MAYSILETGSTVTSGAASANVAIPTNSNSETAKYVRLVSDGEVYVKIGLSGVTATTNDLVINSYPTCLHVKGNSHIAYLEKSTAADLNIAPIEG